jgi:hypothetical protein
MDITVFGEWTSLFLENEMVVRTSLFFENEMAVNGHHCF